MRSKDLLRPQDRRESWSGAERGWEVGKSGGTSHSGSAFGLLGRLGRSLDARAFVVRRRVGRRRGVEVRPLVREAEERLDRRRPAEEHLAVERIVQPLRAGRVREEEAGALLELARVRVVQQLQWGQARRPWEPPGR